MGVRFSQSTIKASFLVQNPGWYRYECTKVMEKPASTGSKNYIMIWEGRRTPDPNSTNEMEGVGVTVLANENADWIWYPLAVAANGGDPLPADTDFDPRTLVGITLEARTVRGQDQQGIPRNNIVEWRPVRD